MWASFASWAKACGIGRRGPACKEAADLASTLAAVVENSSRSHGGASVRWLGDGVMVHFREPAGAVASALELVKEVPATAFPQRTQGVAAGPVAAYGGDHFGRTVNLAARIAGRAAAGQVLVSQRVARAPAPDRVIFTELGEVDLRGFARPVKIFEDHET